MRNGRDPEASAKTRRGQVSAAAWLLGDLYRFSPSRIIGVFLLSVSAVVFRLGTFGLLLVFLRAAAGGNDGSLTVLGARIRFHPDTDDIFVWALVIGLSASLAGLTQFLEARTRLSVGRDYSLAALRSVLGTVAHGNVEVPPTSAPVDTFLRRLATQDSIEIFRAARAVVGLFLPLLTLVGAGIAMAVLQPAFTAALLVLPLLYVVPFLAVSRRAVRASRERTAANAGFRSNTASLLETLLLPQYQGEIGEKLVERYLTSGGVRERLDLVSTLFLNTARVRLLNNMFLGAILFLGLTVIGSGNGLEPEDIAVFVPFVLALRYAYQSVNTITAELATFRRFLPGATNYVDFRRWTAALGDVGIANERKDVAVVRATNPVLPGTRHVVRLESGQRLACVQPAQLTTGALHAWWQQLTGERRATGVFLAVRAARLPDVELLDLLGATPLDLHMAHAEAAGVGSELRDAIKANATGASFISHELRLFVALAACPQAASVVVIPGLDWTEATPRFRAAAIEWFADSALILVFHGARRDMPRDVGTVIVSDADTVLGIGSLEWYRGIYGEVRARMVQTTTPGPPGILPVDDEDDDDDDVF